MRKVIIAVVMLLAAVSLSAQYVTDYNGHDWVQWSQSQKIQYIIGFYAAYESVIIRIAREEGPFDKNDERHIREYFVFDLTVGDMMLQIDSYYATYSNRRYPLHEVLMLSGGKDYWN